MKTLTTPFNKNTPKPPDDLKLPPPPDADTSPICFSTAQIHAAISSFPHGSGSGPDGLRPQHFKDCISITIGDASTSLLTSLTELVNYLANGHLPTDLRPFLYGAQLHGLRKINGDPRPIAVGCTYRCLVAKVCLRPFIPRLRKLLLPSQVGVGTPLTCEAAVHATRYFMDQPHNDKVLLKLDVKNAFNSICRDIVLQKAQKHLPEIYPLIWDCYSSKTSLFHENFSLDLATSVLQGDPLDPALFALAIHEVTSKIKADLNTWYLDDGCIGGDPQTVLTNATMIRDSLSSIGLEINNSKCELLLINYTQTSTSPKQASSFKTNSHPSLCIPDPTHWQLLGSPLHQESDPLHLKAKIKVLDSITENLELIEPHQAFFILKNCLSIPKLTYLLRSAPCFKCKKGLEAFDTAIRTNTEKISNVTFGKDSWSQESMPIRHGGLGLRSAADLSLPCFLSSSFACQGLVNRLLPSLTLPHGEVINETDACSAFHDSSPRQKETQLA